MNPFFIGMIRPLLNLLSMILIFFIPHDQFCAIDVNGNGGIVYFGVFYFLFGDYIAAAFLLYRLAAFRKLHLKRCHLICCASLGRHHDCRDGRDIFQYFFHSKFLKNGGEEVEVLLSVGYEPPPAGVRLVKLVSFSVRRLSRRCCLCRS